MKFLIHFIAGLCASLMLSSCQKMKVDSSNPQVSSRASAGGQALQGNGQGYDGKVYLNELPYPRKCADGSIVSGKIEVSSAGIYLQRWHCADITPALAVPAGSVRFSVDGISLRFRGEYYEYDDPD